LLKDETYSFNGVSFYETFNAFSVSNIERIAGYGYMEVDEELKLYFNSII